MVWAYLLFAVAAGGVLPFQAGINAELAAWGNGPVRAAFVSFLVGSIVLLVAAALVFKPLPSWERLGHAVGFEPRHVTPGRLVGIELVGAGVSVVRIF